VAEIVAGGKGHVVERDHELFVVVRYGFECPVFAFYRGLVEEFIGALKVNDAVVLVGHNVHFVSSEVAYV